jgi:hypothetical protein
MGKRRQPINEDAYARATTEDLILVGIYLVSEAEETCTFERLVSECFSRFPNVFAFRRYPQWPDSLKLDRPLRRLRENGLIVGSVRRHFALTEFGKVAAVQALQSLHQGESPTGTAAKVRPARSADDRLIEFLKTNPLFEEFSHNPSDVSISEPQFRNLLRCTLESPLTALKQNLNYYKKLAEAYDEKELAAFLSFCERQFMGRT